MSCARQLSTEECLHITAWGTGKDKSQQGKKHGKGDVKGFTGVLYSSLQNEISNYLTLEY